MRFPFENGESNQFGQRISVPISQMEKLFLLENYGFRIREQRTSKEIDKGHMTLRDQEEFPMESQKMKKIMERAADWCK